MIGLIPDGWACIIKRYQRKHTKKRKQRRDTEGKVREVKLGLMHTMTRTNRRKPPSLEEGRGW